MIGVVLAGGRSLRMKQDKAALTHPINKHQSFLDFAIDQLMKVNCDKVIVSGERFGGVPDRFENMGPLAGIYSVIDGLWDNRFLIIPVDMPLLDHDILAELVDVSNDHANVYFKQSQFPMLITADDSVKNYLRGVLSNESADRSIKSFFQAIGACSMVCSQPEKLLNANTPEELELVPN